MTQKSLTFWKANPAKLAGVTYNSSTTTYNSSSAAFSSATSNLDEFGKLAKAWTPAAKTATGWKSNPAATISLYVYDSASKVYDSASDTYDGVVSGQDFGDIQTATLWSPL